jgi:hypothetical protein
MTTQGTYYLDAPSLESATIIYSNAELTTIAPDGFYSDGSISREQASGSLLPQVTCPSCISYNCVEGTCIDPGDGSGTYPTLVDCETACSPPLETEIYFNTLIEDTVTMGVNNYASQTFDIAIIYDMYALCDNEGTSGSSPNSATTTLNVSKDGGLTYTTVASITASVPGGDTTPQFDNVSDLGSYTITGVADVTQVKIYGTVDCDTGGNGKDGSVIVTLQSTTPAVAVICNDIYNTNCSGSTLTCTV